MDNAPKYLLSIAFALGATLGGGLLGCAKPSPETKSAEDVEQPEQPQAEEPQAEQPQAEQPQVEEPQAEEPQAEEPQTEEPQEDQRVSNLCTEYTSCDSCIAGQITKGKTKGEAQTQCGAAVAGCWTTWDKPISCKGKTYEKQPS